MMQIIRQNWFYISLVTFVTGFGFIIYKEKNTTEKPKVIYVPQPKQNTKTDSVFAVIDSVLKVKKEDELKKEEFHKKKESSLKRQLEIEKKKKVKQSKPKTKIVIETKEVIVEKEVKVTDPNIKELVKENYKTQEENYKLKEELETLKKQSKINKASRVYRDSISTDTVHRKKRRFFLF